MGRPRSAKAALEAEKKRLEERREQLRKRWNDINDVVRLRALRLRAIQDDIALIETEILKREQALALLEIVDFDDDTRSPLEA